MSEHEIRPETATADRPSEASESTLAAEFAALFRNQPAGLNRILGEHIDDGTGHCRRCSSGAQAGRSVWPCHLRQLAEEATTSVRDNAR